MLYSLRSTSDGLCGLRWTFNLPGLLPRDSRFSHTHGPRASYINIASRRAEVVGDLRTALHRAQSNQGPEKLNSQEQTRQNKWQRAKFTPRAEMSTYVVDYGGKREQ